MALERKTLRAILEDETTDTSGKLKKILDVLHEETDTLQNQLDEKNAALAKAEKDRDAANGGKEAAEKAAKAYEARKNPVQESEEKKPLSGDPERPYSRGRAYDPAHYGRKRPAGSDAEQTEE